MIYTVTVTTTYESKYDRISTPRQAAIQFHQDVVDGWIAVVEVCDENGQITRIDLDVDDEESPS